MSPQIVCTAQFMLVRQWKKRFLEIKNSFRRLWKTTNRGQRPLKIGRRPVKIGRRPKKHGRRPKKHGQRPKSRAEDLWDLMSATKNLDYFSGIKIRSTHTSKVLFWGHGHFWVVFWAEPRVKLQPWRLFETGPFARGWGSKLWCPILCPLSKYCMITCKKSKKTTFYRYSQ